MVIIIIMIVIIIIIIIIIIIMWALGVGPGSLQHASLFPMLTKVSNSGKICITSKLRTLSA
eukprot:10982455-Karenia_brevis.AAC.1